MPRGDGTGPAGMGPMTGRAAGYCAGYQVPGYMNPIPGRGFGYGGRGGGWGRWYGSYGGGVRGAYGAVPPVQPWGGVAPYAAAPYGAPYGAAPTRQQELDALKGQAEYMEDALEGIQKRISELEAEAKE